MSLKKENLLTLLQIYVNCINVMSKRLTVHTRVYYLLLVLPERVYNTNLHIVAYSAQHHHYVTLYLKNSLKSIFLIYEKTYQNSNENENNCHVEWVREYQN